MWLWGSWGRSHLKTVKYTIVDVGMFAYPILSTFGIDPPVYSSTKLGKQRDEHFLDAGYKRYTSASITTTLLIVGT